MAIEVVRVKRRGMSNKRVINLTKAAPPVKSEPEAKPEPKPRRLVIGLQGHGGQCACASQSED
jgi:hypothetical protein